MLKHALRAIAFACATLATQAFAAGTIPYSLTQQFDRDGNLLIGCKLYTIQAGTTSTPQNAFQDTALTIPQPNPMTCDGAGRLPQFFLTDGQIKIRLDDANGVNQVTADNILVIGPSSGGGGGGASVDPTTVLATGDFKMVYSTGTLTGFVRCNGRTLGSAGSGATERANLDTNALFTFLWSTDPNLAVSGGRGASAAADFAANKTIVLPDCRSRAMSGLDDMGNVASGRLTTTFFGTSPIVLGAAGGVESQTLVTANLPAYTPAGSVAVTNGAISINGQSSIIVGGSGGGVGGGGAFGIAGSNQLSASQATTVATFTGTAQGGTSTAFAKIAPRILVTVYIKL